MFTYQLNRKTNNVVVRRDGRVVGEIRPVAGGYQYMNKGQKVGGTVWPNIEQCQQAIESEGGCQ